MQLQVLLPLVITALVVSSAHPPAAAAATCQRRCGDVDIPYPFGIGCGCYLDTGEDGDRAFEVTCSGNGTATVDGFEVLGIDAHRGKLRIRSPVGSWCYDAASRSMANPVTWSYDSSAFRISGADNRLTVLGCNAFAYMDSRDGAVENRYVLGCRAVCSGRAPSSSLGKANGSCDGTSGCCQAPIPPGIRSFEVGFFDDYKNDTSAVAGFSPCSYVVLAEAAAFEFRSAYVTTRDLEDPAGRQAPPVVLDWAVGNRTCKKAQRNTTAYACVSANSECLDSNNGPGYLCSCSKGYQGNPYLVDGCQDINECKDKAVKYPCSSHSICINTPGSFKCSELRWQVAVGVSIGVVVVAIALSCAYATKEKKRLAAVKKRHFKQHGGLLLFEEMKSKQGRLSFSLFTKEEMEEATNMFDERHVLGKGGNGTVYKGTLRDGRVVAIKRCNKLVYDERQQREFGKEMLILSQVNHRNIVKLYGCCLEVEVPMLVYQFIPNGTLYQLIHGDATPSFIVRLKIAHEAAEALAYLHSMASPPIIHGDVKSPNILLDENYTTKVSDFGASALAPTDEAHLVTLVQGTCGYLDPEYLQTCRLTDKSDVYSFGVVLLELLTRRKALALTTPEEERSLVAHFLAAMRDGRLNELLDTRIKGEVVGEVPKMVAMLSKRCLEMSSEKRPSMCEVAEELDRIRKLCHHACLGDIDDSSFLANYK
ncbi:wall-associated receptor kinase 5 [Setaria italica]|nr:wall-associated receptor kinase 5 [Setaria italica]